MMTLQSCEKQDTPSLFPATSLQSIVVVTDSMNSASGSLYYFQRESPGLEWTQAGDKSPIVVGRNGLAWGKGLHDPTNSLNYPTKVEGDGKSPAGMFALSSVFGYPSEAEMADLRMPYRHITEYIECIDDVQSKHYTRIISRDTITNPDELDWKSSEKMRFAGISYALGVVVDHNLDPVNSSGGSCIFLHNWVEPSETTAGCTAMSPADMQRIVNWLNTEKQPVLVQLTKSSYADLKSKWGLPDIH